MRLKTTLATAGAAAAVSLALGAAPALAGTPAPCNPAAKAGFARVQLWVDATCGGGSMIIRDTGDPNRPNFAAFANWDGKTYNVDNSRSSLGIAANTCVRLWDGANYTGDASTLLCAGAGTLYWNLDRLNDVATSIKVCPSSNQAACNGAVAPPPKPVPPKPVPPKPKPTPPPPAGGSVVGGPIGRAEVLARSIPWIQRRVMYSQKLYTDGYRQDCSGYVSLVWHLKGSPNSYRLRSREFTDVIPQAALAPGDALGKPGHIALFIGWAAPGKALVREEYTSGKPASERVWSVNTTKRYTAYRYHNIR